VIAGYHWFTDWGRDAMISLPGLMLATNGFYQGRQVLETFCRHIDRGMIPNRFPDEGEAPEYNTVDATLWMFWAADYYLRCTGDDTFLRNTLYPAFAEIIEHHRQGTRYRIQVDDDGLLFAGEQGVQLTWMDAKAGDWVVTPRIGKPIEINALWHFALSAQAVFAEHLNLQSDAARYRQMADQVRSVFDATFWNEEQGYFNDLIGESGPDVSLRPNQVLALSLPTDLVPVEHARRAMAVVEEKLLTPYGLRSLGPDDPRYIGIYTGDRVTRDAAYHQGTVWSWLIGPYVSAHRKIHGRNPESLAHARRAIRPLLDHLEDACVGSISEVFDGDPPHAPKGCVAQAWSVAEVVRVWLEEGL
jgi:predicted glycogen debranching enzyme